MPGTRKDSLVARLLRVVAEIAALAVARRIIHRIIYGREA
jgi:hypothetical protein